MRHPLRRADTTAVRQRQIQGRHRSRSAGKAEHGWTVIEQILSERTTERRVRGILKNCDRVSVTAPASLVSDAARLQLRHGVYAEWCQNYM